MSLSQWDRNKLAHEVQFLKQYISQFKARVKVIETILLDDTLEKGTHLETLTLDTRLENYLKRMGIVTVEELLGFFLPRYVSSFTGVRHVGVKGRGAIITALIANGHLPSDYVVLNDLSEKDYEVVSDG